MRHKIILLSRFIILLVVGLLVLVKQNVWAQIQQDTKEQYEIVLSEQEWKNRLSPEQYHILREKGTEVAGTGKYNKFYEKGIYYSAASLQPVFSSEAKYNSHSGWPSFWEPVSPGAVKLIKDTSFGMLRWEVVDSKSGSHLGHVFDDGPKPTGKRYCINSAALTFVPEDEKPPEFKQNP